MWSACMFAGEQRDAVDHWADHVRQLEKDIVKEREQVCVAECSYVAVLLVCMSACRQSCTAVLRIEGRCTVIKIASEGCTLCESNYAHCSVMSHQRPGHAEVCIQTGLSQAEGLQSALDQIMFCQSDQIQSCWVHMI